MQTQAQKPMLVLNIRRSLEFWEVDLGDDHWTEVLSARASFEDIRNALARRIDDAIYYWIVSDFYGS